MSEPFIGEIRLWATVYTPKYWLACEGQTLTINSYAALYSLIGTTYGGDGTTSFKLPDLRGRTIMGSDNSTIEFRNGTSGGEETITLGSTNSPQHTHTITADASSGTSAFPSNNYFAIPTNQNEPDEHGPLYTSASGTVIPLNTDTVSSTGGSEPYMKRQPYLTMQYCIATYGIYPPRS